MLWPDEHRWTPYNNRIGAAGNFDDHIVDTTCHLKIYPHRWTSDHYDTTYVRNQSLHYWTGMKINERAPSWESADKYIRTPGTGH
jgi:hypothetical protein